MSSKCTKTHEIYSYTHFIFAYFLPQYRIRNLLQFYATAKKIQEEKLAKYIIKKKLITKKNIFECLERISQICECVCWKRNKIASQIIQYFLLGLHRRRVFVYEKQQTWLHFINGWLCVAEAPKFLRLVTVF